MEFLWTKTNSEVCTLSALTVIEDASGEVGLPIPTTVFASTDANVVQMRTMMNTTAKQMRDAGEWVELTKEHTFTTAASTETYNLPSDYDHINVQTAWDRSDFWPLRESLNGPIWQAIKSGMLRTSTGVSGFRIRGHTSGEFFLEPVPTSALSMVYEYQSKNSVLTSGSVEQVAFTADTDTFILDEYYLMLGITWRFNRGKGFPWVSQAREWTDGINNKLGRVGGAPVIDMGGAVFGTDRFDAYPDWPANIQEGNYLV
jgi:hypothetical protein